MVSQAPLVAVFLSLSIHPAKLLPGHFPNRFLPVAVYGGRPEKMPSLNWGGTKGHRQREVRPWREGSPPLRASHSAWPTAGTAMVTA